MPLRIANQGQRKESMSIQICSTGVPYLFQKLKRFRKVKRTFLLNKLIIIMKYINIQTNYIQPDIL